MYAPIPLALFSDAFTPRVSLGAQLPTDTIPWRLLLSKAPVWALIVCHFCHNWGTFILLTWMPTYYNQARRLASSAHPVAFSQHLTCPLLSPCVAAVKLHLAVQDTGRLWLCSTRAFRA